MAAEDRDAEPEAPISGAGELILVVEDDDAVRAYSTETLRELGYRVIAARNGGRASRCWRAILPSACCSPMSGCQAA